MRQERQPMTRPPGCPDWCTTKHGQLTGEDDEVHVSATLLAGESWVQLCRGDQEPAYLLLDGREVAVHEAEALVSALVQLLDEAAGRLDVTRATA
jgi:hypothetical protein